MKLYFLKGGNIMNKILVLITEGSEEMEATITIDMLRRAGLEVEVASVAEEKTVKCSRGVNIKADITLKDYKGLPEAIVLPGGGQGAKNLAQSKKVNELLKKMNKENNLIAAICASPAVVLAPIGILDDKKATCYPGMEEEFSNTTVAMDEKVVVDNNIITSKGPGTAFYFALEIIKYLAGKEKVNEVKEKALISS